MNRELDISQIKFLPHLREQDHPRYNDIFNYIQCLDRSFYRYQHVFERLVAEKSIMTGVCTSLKQINVVEKEDEHSFFARMVGISQYSIRRTEIAQELLLLFKSHGTAHILEKRSYLSTLYYKELVERIEIGSPRQDRERINVRAMNRIKKFATMYDNMVAQQGLVGSALSDRPSKSLSFQDLPWAIDYNGYIKRMDGAHRRAIAAFLGHQTVPSLVFRVKDADEKLLENSCEYLRSNFTWFVNALATLRNVKVHF